MATTYESVEDLAEALRRAAAAHGEHEKRTGEEDANWPDWYALYMARERAGEESRPEGRSRMASQLRHVDPNRRPSAFNRVYAALANTRLGRFLSVHVVWKLDPHLMRLTRGRLGMGLVMPTALLETRGAKSGARRSNVVIYFHDGERVTIIASKLGLPQNPAWFHNLRAEPDVTFGDVAMRATVVEDEAERRRLWSLADRVFAPYAVYREEAARAGRTIPIVQLSPRSPSE